MAASVFCSVVPYYILRNIIKHTYGEEKHIVQRTLMLSQAIEEKRQQIHPAKIWGVSNNRLERWLYDAQGKEELPGELKWHEGQRAPTDKALKEVCDDSGSTYELFDEIYHRNSIDDKGLDLKATVHFGNNYDNAFWNGKQMVYGDGDNVYFNRFTLSIDVTAHELTHGLTQYEANLAYQGQSGALNESFSDVFGSLVKQWKNKQKADKADWLIGEGLFTKRVKGVALRSMKKPGSAYNDPILGKDPQPMHMKDFIKTTDDNGGVHLNSGIPNHAFYLAATALGGFAWEQAGHIWYLTLMDKLAANASFQDCADQTVAVAANLYGAGSVHQKAVKTAWEKVGINPKL